MHPDHLVPIGRFATATRMTVKALRHYHQEGLLEPARVDPVTGYRYYSWDQLGAAVRIATLRALDVPVHAIRAHLRGDLALGELAAEQRRRRIAEIDEATTALATLEDLLAGVDPGPYGVETVELTTTPTWALEARVDAADLDAGVTALIGELLELAARAELDTTTPVWGEYPATLEGVVRVTVHLPVPTAGPPPRPPARGRSGRIPEGVYARVTHRGSTATLPFAYRSLLAHLERCGIEPWGPVVERYVTDGAELGAGSEIEVMHRLR